MPEQLLDLAQVRAGAEQLGGEAVTQRVRRHAFAPRDPGRFGVAALRACAEPFKRKVPGSIPGRPCKVRHRQAARRQAGLRPEA